MTGQMVDGMGGIKGKVAVVGIGYSKIARNVDQTLAALTVDACTAAVEDAGLRLSDVDGLAVFPSAPYLGAGNRDGVDVATANLLINHLALARVIRWYVQIDLGMVLSAVAHAVNALAAGACSCVLVWRALHQPTARYAAWTSREATGDSQFTAPYGCASILQWHGMAYRRYMTEYGATRNEMATLAVNSRRNADLNDHAFFQGKPMGEDDYMSARMVADPLCLFDCDVPVQGCAALVLTTAERARDLRHPPAYVAGYAQNTSARPELVSYALDDYMACAAPTGTRLWKTTGFSPADVDVAQLYDGFSPSVYYWLEALGFCGRGEAHQFIQGGRIELGGDLPVNTFGGSLSEGRLHGMGHLAEAVRQVTGRAGRRQVADAHVAVVTDGSPMMRGGAMVFSDQP